MHYKDKLLVIIGRDIQVQKQLIHYAKNIKLGQTQEASKQQDLTHRKN